MEDTRFDHWISKNQHIPTYQQIMRFQITFIENQSEKRKRSRETINRWDEKSEMLSRLSKQRITFTSNRIVILSCTT